MSMGLWRTGLDISSITLCMCAQWAEAVTKIKRAARASWRTLMRRHSASASTSFKGRAHTTTSSLKSSASMSARAL